MEIKINFDDKSVVSFPGGEDERGIILALFEQAKSTFIQLPFEIVHRKLNVNKNKVVSIELVEAKKGK